jgi:ribonuclease E
MPNTTHGGGISRKISNVADRKRLKSIMADLQLPSTMGCIVRTAGLSRTKVEIRRDFDYLARVWDGIRETTLKSAAPALINGDSDLIKRAIRDIYNKDIEEVIVEGEEGYRAAREYMKLLMPSHAKKVKPYADAVPLYQRYGAEDQLNAMYQPVVQLKSGGYLVINPTEALVSIDINSGRSTREYGIEQTAVGTNLEAAQEIARQLRLRDMAGLVVIDFIDMENNSNIRKVEKAMKTALANDRARIQVGRISSFGLMEMSRQRLRTGVLEASTRQCPHCEGTGLVRTASSAALSALRMLEDEAAHGKGNRLTLRTSQEASIYVLNRKRTELAEIEERYGVAIDIFPDGETEGARMSVEASGPPPAYRPRVDPIAFIEEDDSDLPDDVEDEDDVIEADGDQSHAGESGESGEARRKRSRRRRGRRGRRDEGGEERSEGDAETVDQTEGEASPDQPERAEGDPGGGERKRNRRGRRGGRGRRGDGPSDANADTVVEAAEDAEQTSIPAADTEAAPVKKGRRRPSARKPEADAVTAPVEAEPVAITVDEAAAPAKPKRSRKKVEVAETPETPPEIVAEVTPVVAEKPKRRSRAKAATANDGAEVLSAPEEAEVSDEGDGKPRRGWWQRTFGADQ